jgi:hypothetical protein
MDKNMAAAFFKIAKLGFIGQYYQRMGSFSVSLLLNTLHG